MDWINQAKILADKCVVFVENLEPILHELTIKYFTLNDMNIIGIQLTRAGLWAQNYSQTINYYSGSLLIASISLGHMYRISLQINYSRIILCLNTLPAAHITLELAL